MPLTTRSPRATTGLSLRPRPRVACAMALLGVALAGLALVAGARQPTAAQAGNATSFADEHLQLVVFDRGEWWNVEIQLLVYDDGAGAFATAAAEARDSALARFPGAIAVTRGEVSAQYELSHYWWAAHTTEWSYNPAGKPASLLNDDAAIRAAAGAWNASGALWSFTGGELTSAGTGGCSQSGRDGENTVGWAKLSANTLGETCTWYPRTGGEPKNASEFDMEIDPDWSWSTGSPVRTDLLSVVTHEFGHALGLAHPPDTECPGALMCARYRSGSTVRTLQPDDSAGVMAIYGAAPAPEPTPAPTPTVGPFRRVAPWLARDP